jgi:hypothetical protein
VRNSTQKSLLAGDQRLNSSSHPVEVLAKHTDLIPTFVHRLRHSGAEMAICDLARRFAQLRHGSGDVTRKPKAKDTRNQQNASQAEEPLNADCREQIPDGDARGDKKENVFSASWSVHSLRRKPVAAWVRRQKGSILSGLESEFDRLLWRFLIQYILAMLIEEVKVYEPGLLHQLEMFP